MTHTSTVDLCLEEIERLKRARDRAVAQRAAMEAALWRSEWLLKKVIDGSRIDVAEIEAFLLEPRHHPEDITLPVGSVGAAKPSEGTDGQGEPAHVDI